MPPVKPRISCRWAKRKKIMIGGSETMTAAKIRFQREAKAPTNV